MVLTVASDFLVTAIFQNVSLRYNMVQMLSIWARTVVQIGYKLNYVRFWAKVYCREKEKEQEESPFRAGVGGGRSAAGTSCPGFAGREAAALSCWQGTSSLATHPDFFGALQRHA